jgi:ankyrin repeat protein
MSVSRIFKNALAAIETFVSNMPVCERDDLLASAGVDLAQGTLRVARKSLFVGLLARHSLRLYPTSVVVLIATGDKALLNSAEEDGVPLCHWAAAQEDDAMLRGLLQAGMRVDSQPTPVIVGASNANAAVVRILLAAGAAADDYQHDVACVAARHPDERVIQALIDAGIDLALCRTSVLAEAAGNRNLLVLRAVLATGIAIAPKDDWALGAASGHPSEQAVEMLLAAGAPITRGAVYWACHNENERVLNVLLRAGAPFDGADPNSVNTTFCHAAAKNRNARVVMSLIAAGADLFAADLHKRVPFHTALLAQNVDVVRAFLALGVDFPLRDRHNTQFQMCAQGTAVGDSLECAYLLLATGYTMTENDLKHLWEPHRPQWEIAVRDEARIAAAKASIKKQRVDFIRWRAMEVCVGLQSMQINALQLCEILERACAPFGRLVPFHTLWNIATTVRHFRQRQTREEDE